MTKANIVLAAVAAVFGVGCLVLLRNLGTERTRILALEAQVAQLQRDLQRPVAAAAESPEQTAPVQSATSSNAAASTAAATKPPAASASAEREIQPQVNADPAYRAVRLAERRSELLPEYPQLAADLGLSTDEAERFLDLLAEQSLRETEEEMKRPVGDVQERRRKLFEQQEQERQAFPGAPVAERVAYMERRARLVEESMARSKEAGAIYLDPTQQRILDAMLDRQSKRARAEVASWQTFWEADERARVAAESR
jgi:hypothetical protein